MIDFTKKEIYVDHSIIAAFTECKERERLGYEVGWRTRQRDAALDFGHAYHAAQAAFYDALAGGWFDALREWHTFDTSLTPVGPLKEAQAAFLRDLKLEGATLPVALESEERRSVERGLALVEAYVQRYKDEPYENIIIDGKPCTEISFKFWLTSYVVNNTTYEVYYVGTIDRLMRNRATGRPVIFEIKTTTQGLDQYIKNVKPNAQIDGYFKEAWQLFPEITECVWDCTFVSKRQPDMAKALTERFWMYGIDISKDFKRQTTKRSKTDITEWQSDIEAHVLDYCNWLFSDASRWPRTKGACHKYRGCVYRAKCSMNFQSVEEERSFMERDFEIKAWDPMRKLRSTPDDDA